MRTTLTLDDDVAAELGRLQKRRQLPLKMIVNDLLRVGLAQSRMPKQTARRFETRSVDLGPCLLGNLDDVAGALALAEGDNFR
jgi:hypothetical protein